MRPKHSHRRQLQTSSVGARALGAVATGALAVGGVALGAMAVGAVAFGALAVGRLAVGRARIRRLEIDELSVRRLLIAGELHAPPLAAAHTSGEPMFDHVKFGVSDYAASKAFFLEALEPLGLAVVSEGTPSYGIELSADGKTSLCMFHTEEKPAPLHLAFTAGNRRQVEAFHRAALQAGGKDNGAPGLRPHYHANYYAAFVIGPDGHNIEAVCHHPEA